MSNVAGEVKYAVTVDTKKLKSGLKEASTEIDKNTKGNTEKLKGLASSVGGVAVNALKYATGAAIGVAGAAAAQVTGIATSATLAFGEYEQLYGGVKSLFKGDAELIAKVQDNANNAWESMQMGVNDYYKQFNNVYSLIAVDMDDQNAAIEQTNKLMSIEADLANTYGYSADQAATAINWALKGTYSYLDNLNIGIVGTKEGFLEAAQGAGFMVESVDQLSSSDIISVIEHYTEKAGALGKSQEEAATTIQGSLNMTKAAWSNLVTGIGDAEQDIAPLIDNLVQSLGTFVERLVPVIETALNSTVDALAQLTPKILDLLPGLVSRLLPAILDAAQALMAALIEAFPKILQTLITLAPKIVEAVANMISLFLKSLPMFIDVLLKAALVIVTEIIKQLPQLLESLVEALLGIVDVITAPDNLILIMNAGVMLLMALIDALPKVLTALANALPKIISNIVEYLTNPRTLALIIEAGVTLFMGLVKATPMILSALFTAFANLIADLWASLQRSFTNFGANFGEAMGRVIKNALNGVFSFIESFINGPINAINGLINVINAVPGVSIGRLKSIKLPRMATGGIVPENANGHLILAGEGGQDEWVVPESKMADMIAKINARTNQGNNITINVSGIYATSESQKREVAMDIWEKINQVNQSRMGALNLGA